MIPMTLQKFQNFKDFIKEDCDFCGLCFHKCPVLNLPLELAKKEIKSIVEESKSEYILTKCTSCMACNNYCPSDCHPYNLILQRWNERYLKNGLPYRAHLALPYDFPNIHSIIMERLPKEEKEWIKEWEANWKNPKNQEIMLYSGCNLLIQPYILKSKLFDDITIFGSTELCCGEPLYRMGCLDAEEQVARHLQKEFSNMGFKKLVLPCLAGYHLFKEVYPDLFDVKFDIEIIWVIDWLLEKIKNYDLEIKPLNLRAVIHDSCWPKVSGDYFFNRVREIIKLCGIEIVEAEHNCENALCCGMGAAAASYSLIYALITARKRLKEFKKSKADVIIDYCGGCNWLFSVAQRLSRKKMPIYNLIEILQMAIGETPLHRTNKRGRKMFYSLVPKIIPKYLKRKKYWIENIMDFPVPAQK